jgi:hypothetical protein
MRAGASTTSLAFALDDVKLVLDRALEMRGLRRENQTLQRAVEQPPLLETTSPPMRQVLQVARQAAASDVSVLLTGESGTGKNVVARAIHQWSARREGPFVTIPCTALAEHLLESELFGHVRGVLRGPSRQTRPPRGGRGLPSFSTSGRPGPGCRRSCPLSRGAMLRRRRREHRHPYPHHRRHHRDLPRWPPDASGRTCSFG